MAYIWHMQVNFASSAMAHAFGESFDTTPFDSPHSGLITPRLGVENSNSGWELGILPFVTREGADSWHLNGHGGATSPEEVADIDLCAKTFYDRLRLVKSRYRFALTGFEVGDWRSAGGLLDDLSPGGLYETQRKEGHARAWPGLVISEHLWWAAERPEGFVRFSADHVWLPFETYAGVK